MSMPDIETEQNEVLLRHEDRIAVITLNRPEKRNCLSLSVLTALKQCIDEVGADASVRVAILEAGGPAFCSGHDLKELTNARQEKDKGRAFYAETMELCSDVMQAIVHCPKPVIASVQGIATAAGCQLVASCDLAVAADVARFATPGVHIGLFCSTPMVALSRNLHRKHAMEMLLTGTMIDAATALNWGLVNRVVTAEDLPAAARELASEIAVKSSTSVRFGKETFYRQLEMPLEEAYRFASEVMVQNMLHRDAEEGIDAFIEKRQPVWSDD